MRKPRCRSDRVQRERPRGRPTDFRADGPAGPPAGEPDADAPPRGRRRAGCWWALLALPVLLIAAWASLVCFMDTFYPPTPVIEAALRRKIVADLPPGSTDEQIKKWLKTNCLQYNWVVNEKKGDVEYYGHMRYSNWPDTGDIDLSFHQHMNGKIYVDLVYLRIDSL